MSEAGKESYEVSARKDREALAAAELKRMHELEAIAYATKQNIASRELQIKGLQAEIQSDKEYLAELDKEYQPLLQRYEGE